MMKLHSKKCLITMYLYTFPLTDKESSFKVYNVMKYSTSFLLKSMHSDWYVCRGKQTNVHGYTPIQLDFYNGDPDVLERCTFSFMPIPQYENKYKNCRSVAGPVEHPAIEGQPLPHPPHLVPKAPSPPVPVQPSCIPVCSATGGGEPGVKATSGSALPSFPLEPSITNSKSI